MKHERVIFTIAIVLSFMFLCPLPSSGYEITDIAVKQTATALKTIIQGEAPLLHEYYTTDHPDRLVIDFPQGTYPPKTIRVPKNAVVSKIRVGNHTDPSPHTRVVLDLSKEILPHFTTSPDKKTLTVLLASTEQNTRKKNTSQQQRVRIADSTTPSSENASPLPLPNRASEFDAVDLQAAFGALEAEDQRLKTGGGPLVSLQVESLDIVQVLRLFGKKAGVNIIPHEKVTGNVSVYLDQEPLENALDLILAAKGYLYKKLGKSYFVYPKGEEVVFPSTHRSQILFEARIMEVAVSEAKKLGIKWGESISAGLAYNNSAPTETITITANLNMLESKDLAKTLASPRIATLNKQTAKIHIGDDVPYVTSTINPSTGAVIPTVKTVETGIKLEITPQIEPDNTIIVSIKPEVSFIFSFVGLNNDVPRVRTRNAESTLRVKPGETIVMGGLLSSEDKQSISKVPIIGNIPLIGNLLFTSKTNEKIDTDLIITITPYLVGN